MNWMFPANSSAWKPKRYAVKASANYRVTFGWDAPDVIDVDLEDYH